MNLNLDEYPIIDQARVNDLISLSPDGAALMYQLKAMFLTTAPRKISSIKAGLGKSDYVAVRKEAHALKSTSANLGAKRLSRVLDLIEHTSPGQLQPYLEKILQTLDSEFNTICGIFKKDTGL
jgi:HPt (histidine-containing phosphotransfer) domain-containing protein